MSERRLKLGHRKEYKRKSKHTRNPSYYPRHLTKVTLADFDADFNLRVRLLNLIKQQTIMITVMRKNYSRNG